MNISVPFVDLSFQTVAIRDEFSKGLQTLLDSSAFVGGSLVERFEHAWASYLGCDAAVGVGNGGDAIEIGLRALNIGGGDEVIIPANTFAATAQAVLMAGAIPVAVDVSEDSNLIDAEAVRDAVTSKTRAVIAVNLYGERFNDPDLVHWCNNSGIHYCEDAAQSHGAISNGKRLTPGAAFTAFSFYPGKNLGAFGDAGAVVFGAKEHTLEARRLRNYGGIEKYSHERTGRNSRLDAIQALVLLLKLERLDDWNHMRSLAAREYFQQLSDLQGPVLSVPTSRDDGSHVWHLFVVEARNRRRLANSLSEAGIGWGIHYPSIVNTIPGVRGDHPTIAAKRSSRIISLPIFPGITKSQIDLVCEIVRHEVTR